MSVTVDGLTAETGVTIKAKQTFMWNWHIIYPISHHDELPLYQRKAIFFRFGCKMSHTNFLFAHNLLACQITIYLIIK